MVRSENLFLQIATKFLKLDLRQVMSPLTATRLKVINSGCIAGGFIVSERVDFWSGC